MSEQRKRELLEAAERAMASWQARPLESAWPSVGASASSTSRAYSLLATAGPGR